MKKLLAAGALAVVAFGFSPGHAADDNRFSDTDCAASEAGPFAWTTGTDEEGRMDPGRGAICVSDGDESNGAELYVGGELDTESSENVSCGAIEVAGIQGTGADPDLDHNVFGDDDWGGDDCQ